MTEDQILAIGIQVGLCDAEGSINLEYDYKNQIMAFAYLVYDMGFTHGRQKEIEGLAKRLRFSSQNLQRPWVGLTDEEMLSIEEATTCTKDESWLRNVTRAIEQRLKEKNA